MDEEAAQLPALKGHSQGDGGSVRRVQKEAWGEGGEAVAACSLPGRPTIEPAQHPCRPAATHALPPRPAAPPPARNLGGGKGEH
ncbi:hypothetical protein E2C01_090769 [Portunus trituberculatus]|uniref:Uncharacterized protein n=1 Tax=Portunus trituberculatus TaxID=210409 RepID=A0A5B7JHH5_PORTR|nr:hypothetical protein [Portunus trituberculatus]